MTLLPAVTHQPGPERRLRVGLISLGCAKNLVDSEVMLGALLEQGWELIGDTSAADALVINTCSFIGPAQEESLEVILESAKLRQTGNPGQALIVAGCFPQRFQEALPQLLPEVDAFIGVDQAASIAEVVGRAVAHRRGRLGQTARSLKASPRAQGKAPPLTVSRRPTYLPDAATPRQRLTPRHFAYVKIAEGCSHPCSFCLIPRLRGGYRSRPLADIVREARRLLAEGVKELNLISQDSTFYGRERRAGSASPLAAADRSGGAGFTLSTLLRELNALPGKFWIRLLYTHPAHWTDELIQTIADCLKVARYADIPLQHIDELMLQRMRRETSPEYVQGLLRRLRAGIPGIAIRTTFIVGFPAETEPCFQRLIEFIRDVRFERLGVFAYSREEGTVAARMAGQVAEKTKQRRRDLLMSAQQAIAREVSASFVGRVLEVLVERRATASERRQVQVLSWEHGLLRAADGGANQLRGTYYLARSQADAPEIDGRVYVQGRLPVGDFARVRVIGHTDYDLIARPV